MIKAELLYNPYIAETSIRFNGQSPKINSLVEKYQGSILNDWIDRIPGIFHDEMNGYGFELDFSGTLLDFQNLQAAFERLGITSDDVPIFFKNELESRNVKVERIEKLLDWLKNHPNRNFDYAVFKEVNSELLDDLYIYKILQGRDINSEILKDKDISVEIITDVNELDLTNLTNIPVLVYISSKTLDDLQKNINYLLKRHDVKLNQVFFYIENNCDLEKIERTISDLGITNPQIVSSIYDEKVRRYFEIYPITEYIRQTIRITRELTDKLQIEINKRNINNQASEKKANTTISKSDNKIQELKKLDDSFINRDNIELPNSFIQAKNELMLSIENWRNKKTVITKDGEAQIVAQEFEYIFQRAFEEFWNSINVALIRSEERIRDQYHAIYSASGIDPNYKPNVDLTSKISSFTVPMIKDRLVGIKEEKYVLPKEGLIDQVFKTNEKAKFLERVINYYYKDWREFVLKLATEISDKEIETRFSYVKKYAEDLAQAYHDRITVLLQIETSNKSTEINQLSEAEKLLQIDTDWLNSVIDQIHAIERG